MSERSEFDRFMERLHDAHQQLRRGGHNPFEFHLHINPDYYQSLRPLVPKEYAKEWTDFIPFLQDPDVPAGELWFRLEVRA